MAEDITRQLRDRFEDRVRQWCVVVNQTMETESSLIGFGTRGDQPVVLKLIRRPGDEWRSGEILDAFDGKGVVRVYEYVEGAVLLERLSPGNSLVGIALNDGDDEATEILADVIQKMSPRQLVKPPIAVEDWAKGFERYSASGDDQIPKSLVEKGYRVFLELCRSQSSPRLLHGDLHHYNVLFDSDRGWLAIDPKGVVGEIEYEVGAVLRNPYERPELFGQPSTVETRLKRLESKLSLDFRRALAWGFAQAVLSAIWGVEDGFAVDAQNPGIVLAEAIRPMLEMQD
ncbi:MAG TPA: aminoglycoside phosphotransferase family protein [Pyrinomonadaceae bacterium]|nr:aminoglycoside phosphotransferase family protein [Pyrinomonadaceae bacterium]